MQLKTRKKRGKSNRKRMSNLAWLWSSCSTRNDLPIYSRANLKVVKKFRNFIDTNIMKSTFASFFPFAAFSISPA